MRQHSPANYGHWNLREVSVLKSSFRTLRILTATDLTFFRLLHCLGLDCHRLHLATACHPSHAEIHHRVTSASCVLFVRWGGTS